jgi:hypothetical protein
MKRVKPDDALFDEELDADMAPVPWREKPKSECERNPPRRMD